jgi:hypothetical protein
MVLIVPGSWEKDDHKNVMIFDTVVPMPNLLEQHNTRPRLVAVVGGRRRPAPPVSATRNRAVRAATRANRNLTVLPGGRARRPDHDVTPAA